MGCFDDEEKVEKVLTQLKKEDLGMSVVVTGLRDKVEKICKDVGLTPHSADLSLGIFGKTEKLPDEATLSFTTMCGHAMISAGLVVQIRKAVARGAHDAREGPSGLAKPCYLRRFSTSLAQRTA